MIPSARDTRRSELREKQRVHVSDLYLVQTPKASTCRKQVKLGRTAEQILSSILPRAVHDLSWPRSMTWTGLDGARFIRPIRWIVAVLGGKPLKLSVAGIAAGAPRAGIASWALAPSLSGTS